MERAASNKKSSSTGRRPHVSSTVQRRAAQSQTSAGSLQKRLGNHATNLLIARSRTAPVADKTSPPKVDAHEELKPQLSSASPTQRVSQPNDPAEREAEQTARTIMRMPAPNASHDASKDTPKEIKEQGHSSSIHRSTTETTSKEQTSASPVRLSGGSPLPDSVQRFMEPRFGANFSNVRIHTGAAAAKQSAQLQANAFTVGNHIAFGQGKYQPQSDSGRELIAHELTHTIQQGASPRQPNIARSANPTIQSSNPHEIQRAEEGNESIFDLRGRIARLANNIPGFTMITWVIGFNPISGANVDRNAGNLLRATINLIPGGNLISQALQSHGLVDQVGEWVADQFLALKGMGSSLKAGLLGLISSLFGRGSVIEKVESLIEGTYNTVKNFAVGLFHGIVGLIKKLILQPLGAFARKTKGYVLLSTVLEKDPITDEKVERNPESLMGAFLGFIGEEEIWKKMQEASAIPRAYTWFLNAVATVKGFVSAIPDLFISAFQSLQLADILALPIAFAKLVGVFGGFVTKFITWGAQAAWNLLEIVFDVVCPGALVYVKRTGQALRSILKNPIPFVLNLVRAAKAGFQGFAGNFLTHLKTGLIEWLTGSLPGVYIPKAFALGEIAKFAFSVLGLSWANLRLKLVKAVGEPVVSGLESGFGLVQRLVREGPAAAWEMIKDQLSNLKDMVIGGITGLIVETVVQKAIPKLIAMFIPGAGFISAIVTIYDTIMVFVDKIRQIVAVVTNFIDSIVAIAAGNIGAAAQRVESALANSLSLAINFLAGFAGLGKVADKIMGIINRIRAPIDKALDWLVNWIVNAAKKLAKKTLQAGVPKDPEARRAAGMNAAAVVVNRFAGKSVGKHVLMPLLTLIKIRYKFTSLEVVNNRGFWRIIGVASPETSKDTKAKVKLAEAGEDLFVGSYGQSRYGNKLTGLLPTHTPHHSVQNAVASQNNSTHSTGITINMRKDLHEKTRTFKKPVQEGLSLRQHLAMDVKDIKKILTEAGYDRKTINAQLQELIRQNKAKGGFNK